MPPKRRAAAQKGNQNRKRRLQPAEATRTARGSPSKRSRAAQQPPPQDDDDAEGGGEEGWSLDEFDALLARAGGAPGPHEEEEGGEGEEGWALADFDALMRAERARGAPVQILQRHPPVDGRAYSHVARTRWLRVRVRVVRMESPLVALFRSFRLNSLGCSRHAISMQTWTLIGGAFAGPPGGETPPAPAARRAPAPGGLGLARRHAPDRSPKPNTDR